MQNAFEIIFWASLAGATYSYFLYPLVLLCMPKQNLIFKPATDSPPFLSIIITAYNEESKIDQKIRNTLDTSYPRDRREILVASDGSTDNTNSIVLKYAEQGVRLIDVPERKGKENAQLAAILASKGEILVFSDTATILRPDALDNVATAFSDPKVGAVSSEDKFITEDGKTVGEGTYVKYEMWLRRKEASVKSLVGLSGSFFACRKQICMNWDISVPSDFNTAINCVTEGFIAISDSKVLGYYPDLKDESKEYQRKTRTVVRGMAAVASNLSVLNPLKFGFFAFEIFSHKIMRWLVPWFLVSTLLANLAIWEISSIYVLILAMQFAFYGLAICGWLIPFTRKSNLIKIPFFFSQVNLAIAHATIKFLSGQRITTWEPSKR